MTLAWAGNLATTDQLDGTVVLLLPMALYNTSVETNPDLASLKLTPLVNVYVGDDPNNPTQSVNLKYPNQAAVIAAWPAYWYDPNDI